jgi:ATP-dependent DNA helicase RecG
MSPKELEVLVRSVVEFLKEREWLEFKHNKADPHDIGEYLSALSNSAALLGESDGYIIWGISDDTHAVVGTSFKPRETKVGNEDLENWLVTQLFPRINVQIHEAEISGYPVVVFQVQPAPGMPVRFKDTEFIRVGSYKKKLKDHPEKERALWAVFAARPFETEAAVSGVSSGDVLDLIDYPSYFRLMNQPLPDNRAAILERLASERIVVRKAEDKFDVCNVGAVLFAYDLKRFDRLTRKAPRVVIYRGENRVDTVREQMGIKGYAVAFEGLTRFITDQLPQNEQLGQVFRREVRMYPEVAIRELMANALIHQDFSLTGTGPLIEIFSDRMEISNPGTPLIDTLRFIDEPPRSRNEILAGMMRRINICEERGSGIDKVIDSVEIFQLPAPDFRVTEHHTVAVLFGPRDLSAMDKGDRIRACYQHACLWFVSGKRMTNASLRKRLDLDDNKYTIASRIIADTIDADLIKSHDPSSESRKHAKYVPFWA